MSLHVLHRAKDDFSIVFLEECRRGGLSWEMCNFLPQRGRAEGRLGCGSDACRRLAAETWPAHFAERVTWQQMR